MPSQPSHNNRNNVDADVDVDQESLGSLKDRFSAAHLPVDIHPRHLASYQRTPPILFATRVVWTMVCTVPASYGLPYVVVRRGVAWTGGRLRQTDP